METVPARILVVDDMTINLQVAGTILKGAGMEALLLSEGAYALETAAEEAPDLILLDVMMPDKDGLQICRELKADPRTADIPVVFLTALMDGPDIVRGFEAGGIDYVGKPVRAAELIARVRSHVDLSRARKSVVKYAEELAEANRKLEEMATHDALTELPNRRLAWSRLENEHARSMRSGRSWCVAIGDIDHFKAVNDGLGHSCGDVVLSRVARILSEGLRGQDMVARWGGEEFLFILPETDREGSLVLADKLRNSISSEKFACSGSEPFGVTISIGIAQCDAESVDEAVNRADDALYEAKASGRNRIVFRSSPRIGGDG